MAVRSVLHIKHIDAFKGWLESEGWEIHPPRGVYEVIRAKLGKRLLIVFQRANAKEHCSVRDEDMWIVREYYKNRSGDK